MADEKSLKAKQTEIAVAKWGVLLPHLAKDSIMLWFDGFVAKQAKDGVGITGIVEGTTPKGYPCSLVSFSNNRTFYAYGHKVYAVKKE